MSWRYWIAGATQRRLLGDSDEPCVERERRVAASSTWTAHSRRPVTAAVPPVGPHASDRARTQPLAAVLVLVIESDSARRCCGSALLVHDVELGCSSSRMPSPGEYEYEYRFAEYEHEMRGRLMCGPSLARPLVRPRSIASFTTLCPEWDRDLAAPDHPWSPRRRRCPDLDTRIARARTMRGPLRSGILVVRKSILPGDRMPLRNTRQRNHAVNPRPHQACW